MAEVNVADAHAGLFAPSRRAASVGAIALISMLAFEAMAVTTAMPTIATALDGIDHYALAFGATLATSVIGMVVAGLACDHHGPRRPMRWGLLLFAAGLLLAGLADSMTALITGRGLQGLGSGMIGVAIYAAVGRLYPAFLHPRIFALFAAAWVIPALAGPAVTSLIVYAFGWRWVFLAVALLLPPAGWPVLVAMRGLSQPDRRQQWTSRPAAAKRIGYAVLAACAALMLHDYGSAPATTSLLQGVAGLALMALAAGQLLPSGTLVARRGLPTVIALRGLLASAFFATEAFLPLWLVLQHHWSTAAAGLALSAGALMWSGGSAVQSRYADPGARQRLLTAGLGLVAAGISAVAALAACGRWPALVLLAWALVGFGTGLAFPSISVLMLQLSGAHEQGSHSSALQLSDALTTTALLALCGGCFAALQAQGALAFSCVFACSTAVAVLATLLSTRVRSTPQNLMPSLSGSSA